MKKVNLLILGNSNFVQRRVINSLNKIKEIDYKICSKSQKNKKIYFNNYTEALKSEPDIVYISLVNHLHYKYAKIALKKGFHVIVDKPIAPKLYQVKELIKIAKKKNVLLSEATLFNYHEVFYKINSLIGGNKNLKFIQSNFTIPQKKTLKQIELTQSDCFMDMSPYASSLIRLYLESNVEHLTFFNEKFKNNKSIKNFYILAKNSKIKYFGNFAVGREYLSQIIFTSEKKIIYLDFQAFALPSNKKIKIILKENNKFKNIYINKDDSIKNYFKKILSSINNKRFDKFYNIALYDSKIKSMIFKGKKSIKI
ncbi:Gfo/Idh/MocA family oxidoreductase [Candidatus Pelagibacter sp.]|jgi:predicted dehydrogenase|nr:Gfo/Idh/MocA family oxidoreductase [Candidatus Pelagibacter sp.]